MCLRCGLGTPPGSSLSSSTLIGEGAQPAHPCLIGQPPCLPSRQEGDNLKKAEKDTFPNWCSTGEGGHQRCAAKGEWASRARGREEVKLSTFGAMQLICHKAFHRALCQSLISRHINNIGQFLDSLCCFTTVEHTPLHETCQLKLEEVEETGR